ncbi:MAG: hypothetical protein IKA02_02070 [Clostridia bacterium]|nr:hypothetical protein [Clostridia bacterium]
MSKKKKNKVTYVDDGRTIADMSGVNGMKKTPKNSDKFERLDRPDSSFKAQWNTYWSTVKSMLLPMLVVIGIICVAFGLMYILL